MVVYRKGKHAYYYAHHRTDMDTDVFVYDDKPQKLSVSTSEKKKVNNAGGSGKKANEQKKPVKIIQKYSWADFKKSVRIYIELEGIDALTDSNILLKYEAEKEESTLKIKLLNVKASGVDPEGRDYELVIAKLHDKIKKATFKKKENNRLVVSLQKATDFTWYELQQK